MGLFRFILRALFGKGNRRHRRVSRSRTPYAPDVAPWKNPHVSVAPPVAPAVSFVAAKLVGRCYVVDGDTLVIDHVPIRLAGIDAPELDQPYGNKAKWALINLCKGQVVTAVLDGSSTYDRPVATCYLPDGRDLSEEMVKRGMALDWRRFSGGKYRHFEPPEARRLLWRVDAKHMGRLPPPTLDV